MIPKKAFRPVLVIVGLLVAAICIIDSNAALWVIALLVVLIGCMWLGDHIHQHHVEYALRMEEEDGSQS